MIATTLQTAMVFMLCSDVESFKPLNQLASPEAGSLPQASFARCDQYAMSLGGYPVTRSHRCSENEVSWLALSVS